MGERLKVSQNAKDVSFFATAVVQHDTTMNATPLDYLCTCSVTFELEWAS